MTLTKILTANELSFSKSYTNKARVLHTAVQPTSAKTKNVNLYPSVLAFLGQGIPKIDELSPRAFSNYLIIMYS